MIFTVKNAFLSLSVDSLGAQMQSIKTANGIEYLWQGDEKYWVNRAPNLFPFVARMWQKKFVFEGKEYPTELHGFTRFSEFSLFNQTADTLVFRLDSNDEIRAIYPFEFSFFIIYRLCGKTLEITFRVENHGDKKMHFAVGGHPGFNTPICEDTPFEDYYIEFESECQPTRVGFSPEVHVNGNDAPYQLVENKILSLRHELFDNDAIVLKNAAPTAYLCSKKLGKILKVSYPQMPIIAFWQYAHRKCPYICFEPWSALPGRQDIVEDISLKEDLIHLPPHETYNNTWSIEVLK